MPQAKEVTGLTTIEQEACERVDVFGTHRVIRPLTTSQAGVQDLREYAARPVVVGRGNLPTAYGSFFSLSGTFRDFLSNNANLSSRFQGANGIRADLVFTMQVAATPFTQGIIALAWEYGDAPGFSRTSHVGTLVNLPHVRLDVANTTMVVLRVPFMSPADYSVLRQQSDGELSYGRVVLSNLLPSATGPGGQSPNWTLLMHLENVELFGAVPLATSAITIQSGLSALDSELSDSRPLSSALASASQTMRFLGKGIPSLSSISGPASWFLRGAAGAVRSFGYSKPAIVTEVKPYTAERHIREFNVDSPSCVPIAGPTCDNHLTVDPSFAGTDVDEMSLAFVLSRWSYICMGKLNTSTPTNQPIYATYVSPITMWHRDCLGFNVAANRSIPANPEGSPEFRNAIVVSNQLYFASMFRQWRGSFRYRFTFCKTPLHAGRVMVVFNPDRGSYIIRNAGQNTGRLAVGTDIVIPNSTTAANLMPASYSKIFDLRDGNSFEFDVPYTSEFPYTELCGWIGSLSMFVYDELQAPPVAPAEITFMVEVCAAGDFELAVPSGPKLIPHINTPQIKLQSGLEQLITLQSGLVAATSSPKSSQHCIGERLQSVKQLVMMPSHSCLGSIDWNADTDGRSFALPVWPWWAQSLVPNVSPLTLEALGGATRFAGGRLGWGGTIAACYLYARGSTDVHLYYSASRHVGFYASYGRRDGNNSWDNPRGDVTIGNPGALPLVVGNSAQGTLRARFPTYARAPRMYTHLYRLVPSWTYNSEWSVYQTENELLGSLGDNPLAVGKIICALPTFAFQSAEDRLITTLLFRSAGDDAQLGHYVGPPPVVWGDAYCGTTRAALVDGLSGFTP